MNLKSCNNDQIYLQMICSDRGKPLSYFPMTFDLWVIWQFNDNFLKMEKIQQQ